MRRRSLDSHTAISLLFALALPACGEGPMTREAATSPAALQQSLKAVDIFDSRVFNWLFYINSYADLLAAGIHSESAAQNHWRTHGIAEGRQASPTFHTLQYLDQYADLQAAFGRDTTAALTHYLTNGASEGRRGFTAGGGYGRYTIANDIIAVSASDRTGGAVDSVVWNGRELVNSWDHGRQVQLALSINGWGECYNPTEAGGGFDAQGATTTSQLLAMRATLTTLSTRSKPAFWMKPGEPHPFPSPTCTVALNTTPRSEFQFTKDVQIGVAGIRHAIQFLSTVYVPEDVSSLTLEGPTGYLNGDLTAFYTVDLDSAILTRIPAAPPGEQQLPLVVATPDGSYAMGSWSPELPQLGNPGGYGKFAFPSRDAANATNKWNIVFRHGALAAGTTLSHRAYLVVGSLEDVRVAMKQLYDTWRAGGI